jgi:deoxyribodipyrimidine photolyase
MRAAIWWVSRNLRLADDPALTAGLDQAEQILPVLVLDPALLAYRTPSSSVNRRRLARRQPKQRRSE